MEDAAAKNKYQPPAADAPLPDAKKKKPTTLLDAYEVECIRRELERIVLKQQNQRRGAATGSRGGAKAAAAAPGTTAHDGHHSSRSGGHKTTTTTTTSASMKKVKVSPSTPARGVRLLGRHAVAICSGTVPVPACGRSAIGGAGAGDDDGRRQRRGGYREVEKV